MLAMWIICKTPAKHSHEKKKQTSKEMEKLWRHAEIVSAADAEEGEMYLQDNTKIDCIHMEFKVKW